MQTLQCNQSTHHSLPRFMHVQNPVCLPSVFFICAVCPSTRPSHPQKAGPKTPYHHALPKPSPSTHPRIPPCWVYPFPPLYVEKAINHAHRLLNICSSILPSDAARARNGGCIRSHTVLTSPTPQPRAQPFKSRSLRNTPACRSITSQR